MIRSHVASTIEWLDKALAQLDTASGAVVVAAENTTGGATHAEPGDRLQMADEALANVRGDLFQLRVQLIWARDSAKTAQNELDGEREAARG